MAYKHPMNCKNCGHRVVLAGTTQDGYWERAKYRHYNNSRRGTKCECGCRKPMIKRPIRLLEVL